MSKATFLMFYFSTRRTILITFDMTEPSVSFKKLYTGERSVDGTVKQRKRHWFSHACVCETGSYS